MSIAAVPVVLIRAISAWWSDDALRLGASVAYYTLFAIAPILIVATAAAGTLFGTNAVHGQVVRQIDSLIGVEGGQAVRALLEGAARREDSVVAATIGSVTLALAACGAFLELQAALNTIWRVTPTPGGQVSATASAYGAVGSVLVLLLWVYYSSQIVLIGAEFTRLYADRTRGLVPVSPIASHTSATGPDNHR